MQPQSFQKQLLIQIGIAAAMIGISITAVQVVAWHLSSNAGKITKQRGELALRTRATESLATLKSDAEKAKPFAEVLNNVLPSKDRLINFGKELTDLAKQNGAEMSFDFGGETASTPETPGFIKFSMTGVATYGSWTKLLKDLEKSRLYIKINSTDLTRQPGTDSFNIVAEGQVFFQ